LKKTLVTLVVVALAVGLTAGGFAAVTKGGTKKLSAKLSAGREVPKPKGVPAGATGTFTGTLVGRKVKFKLTFAKLSGKALAAHIHKGKAGKAGPVIVTLCGPCKSGVTKTVTVSSTARNAIERNLTYVNVHTAKNQAGEIRGQVKATEAE
jgi:CHRD domain-containing protein